MRLIHIAVFCIALALGTSGYGRAQSPHLIRLTQAVDSLSLHSPAAQLKHLDYTTRLLQSQNYRLSFLPALSLSLSPINFNRSLRLLQRPEDGSYRYIEDYSNNTSIGLSIRQKIRLTGGEINISSNLGILSEISLKRTSFSSTPFSIGYSQQLWGARHLAQLEDKIEHLRLKIVKKQHLMDLAKIQQEVVRIYMDAVGNYLEFRQSKDLCSRNDSLKSIASLRMKHGQITEYDYNQIQLQTLNQEQNLEATQHAYEQSLSHLASYLGIDSCNSVNLPDIDLPIFLDLAQVQADIELRNPFALQQELEAVTSDQALYQAKLSTYVNGNISLSYGVNQHAYHLAEAYRNGNVRQAVNLSLQIPIFQWGINKNKLRIAKNTHEANRIQANIKAREFQDEVTALVHRYNHAIKRWHTAQRTHSLAQRQYDLLIQKFGLGKVSLYELIMGERDLQGALKSYYTAMQDALMSYYSIRALALVDYQRGMLLEQLLRINE